MRRVRVKVCGITNREDLEAAVDAGADALGFVVDVPESPRNISVDRARDLVEAMPPFVQGVLVSVFHTIDQLETLCSCLAPDAVQVAGTLPRDAIGEQLRGIRVIQAVAVNNQAADVALPTAHYDAVITDSCVPGAYGGTGEDSQLERQPGHQGTDRAYPPHLSGRPDAGQRSRSHRNGAPLCR